MDYYCSCGSTTIRETVDGDYIELLVNGNCILGGITGLRCGSCNSVFSIEREKVIKLTFYGQSIENVLTKSQQVETAVEMRKRYGYPELSEEDQRDNLEMNMWEFCGRK